MVVTSSSSRGGGGFMAELLIIAGLIAVQVFYAAYTVVLNRILALGVDPLFLVISGSFVSAVLLLPFAVALEKKKWPTRLGLRLMVQFTAIGVGGVTAFQNLMLMGIEKTSPAIASSMPNLAPGFIFIIAACLRFERFSLWCKFSRAKVVGTLVCLGGAISMSFLLSSSSPPTAPSLTTPDQPGSITFFGMTISKEYILGCFFLLAAVICISCVTVLQAATMVNFPAPFSLVVITSLMGSIITALLQFALEGKLDAGSSNLSIASIIVILLGGGVVASICVTYQTWCVNRKGPVMVSIFSPIQTVSSAILSAIVLGQAITLGSLAGMLLMFAGLYIVLWAKKKEDFDKVDIDGDATRLNLDVEKPLLS